MCKASACSQEMCGIWEACRREGRTPEETFQLSLERHDEHSAAPPLLLHCSSYSFFSCHTPNTPLLASRSTQPGSRTHSHTYLHSTWLLHLRAWVENQHPVSCSCGVLNCPSLPVRSELVTWPLEGLPSLNSVPDLCSTDRRHCTAVLLNNFKTQIFYHHGAVGPPSWLRRKWKQLKQEGGDYGGP